MRKCLLHIGTHKTATTSIQRLLDDHPQELELDGFLYPAVGRPDQGAAGHHNLAWEISGDRRFRSDFGTEADIIRELASTGRNIVLSSEDFESSAHYPERFGRFVGAIRELGIGVSLLIFVRDQIGYAESLYSTLLEFGYTQPFTAFCDEILATGEVRWREWIFPFRYDKFLADLESIAGVELIIRSYDRPVAGSPVLEFLAAVGLAPQRYLRTELPHDNRRSDLGDCVRRYWKNRAGYLLNDRDLQALLAPFRQAGVAWPTMSPACRARFVGAFDEPNRYVSEKYQLPSFELAREGESAAVLPLDEIFTSDTSIKVSIDAEPDKRR